MSIVSLSTANTAGAVASLPPAAPAPNSGTILAVTQSTAASQTTVTLSSTTATNSGAASLTYDQLATQDQLLQEINTRGNDVADNSIALLMTGQNKMAAAMDSLNDDWSVSQQAISAERPDLLKQNWDIATDQGTIQVVSSTMSAADKAWLTGMLNQNAGLVADTQSINTILVSTFGGTAAEAAEDTTGMTLSALTPSTVDGKVHFLSLLQGVNYGVDITSPNVNLIQAELTESANVTSAGQVRTDLINSQGPATGDRVHGTALNVAYLRYLYPALVTSSVQDGTADIYDGLNIPSVLQPLANEFQNVMSGMMQLGSGWKLAVANDRTETWLAPAEDNLSAVLGSNYRSYGEALSAENASGNDAPISASAAENSPAITTKTGVGAIQDIYQAGSNAKLNAAQGAIQSTMQTFGRDWNTSKAMIASVRPALLSQNWDFVTDQGTLQAISSGSTPLTEEQKLWLTGILNQNAGLVADTQKINQELVNFYDKTPAGSTKAGKSSANSNTLAGLTMQSIDGTIPFLALMAGTDPGQLIQQGLIAKAAELNGNT